jgi:Bacterial Ig-like domain (group 2)
MEAESDGLDQLTEVATSARDGLVWHRYNNIVQTAPDALVKPGKPSIILARNHSPFCFAVLREVIMGYKPRIPGNAFALSLVLAVFLAGCPTGPGGTEVAGVYLYQVSTKILCDRTEQLVPIIDPPTATNQNLTWSSSDESVAIVADGLVTGVAAGIAVVTVETEDGDFTANCSVAVYEPPTVTTAEIATPRTFEDVYTFEIAGTSAKGGGDVTSEGGLPVVERGLCWNTTGLPTTGDPHAADGDGPGAFSEAALTDLSENTLYSVRAYAETEAGVVYGDEVVFNSGYSFGSDHAGGYVFYNDGEGGGYVAAKTDQSPEHVWSNIFDALVDEFALWDAFWNGLYLTRRITEQTDHEYSAASVCVAYTVEEDDVTYDDWFLPTATAMVQMSEKLYNPLPEDYSFEGKQYWSSTETAAEYAAAVSMQSGSITDTVPKDSSRYVRAAREF